MAGEISNNAQAAEAMRISTKNAINANMTLTKVGEMENTNISSSKKWVEIFTDLDSSVERIRKKMQNDTQAIKSVSDAIEGTDAKIAASFTSGRIME